MDTRTASEYIRANFRPDDRLAAVLVRRGSGGAVQRIAPASTVASDEFQEWLRYMNREKHDIYVSMNTLKADAHGRTKADVQEIRHIYLDFDNDAAAALGRVMDRGDVPTLNHVVESSQGKYQVIWRVEEFGHDQAESLMRDMVREWGADPAATDSARVLRVPGYYNHKYSPPKFVRVENLTEQVYRPADFPEFADDRGARFAITHTHTRTSSPHGITQSERDWAFARRELARGTALRRSSPRSNRNDPTSPTRTTMQSTQSQRLSTASGPTPRQAIRSLTALTAEAACARQRRASAASGPAPLELVRSVAAHSPTAAFRNSPAIRRHVLLFSAAIERGACAAVFVGSHALFVPPIVAIGSEYSGFFFLRITALLRGTAVAPGGLRRFASAMPPCGFAARPWDSVQALAKTAREHSPRHPHKMQLLALGATPARLKSARDTGRKGELATYTLNQLTIIGYTGQDAETHVHG